MKIKNATLAAAVSALIGLGAAGQAAADVYAGSRLLVDQFNIFTFDSSTPANPIFPGSYNMGSTTTGTLDGAIASTFGTCSGTYGGGAPTCVSGGLNPGVADVGGGRVNSNTLAGFTYLGPGTGQYGSSDAAILSSELLGAPYTSTGQIAEAELQTATSASANAEIRSSTSYSVVFDVGSTGPMNLVMNFLADPSLWAHIDDNVATSANALANMNVSFSLTRAGGGGLVNWTPNGNLNAADCIAAGVGLSCTETADAENLNQNRQVGALPTSDDRYSRVAADPLGFSSDVGFQPYGISINGISAGTWTLTLNSVTSAQVSRVPEPGMLALLGIGLAGMGAVQLRRRKKTAA
jgi:hypothetical protein